MPAHFFFYFGLSCILIHEMDAIRCKEWQIFPGLALLEDRLGFQLFMLAHIPLYLIILLALADPGRQNGWVFGLNIFFLVHLGLHLLFLKHPKNQFKDVISWIFIGGAAVGGGLDLILAP
ncbi:MAG: DUF6713 family protein [Bacteroidota bacterium]